MRYLFILIIFFSIHFLSCDELIFAVGEWEPFITENSDNYGLSGELVIEAFKTQGIDVKLKFYPWKRASAMVESGLADGSFPWHFDEHKEIYALFSDSIFTSNEYFFYKKSRFPNGVSCDDFKDLNKYRVGGTNGYKLINIMINKGIKNIDISPTPESGFYKLDKGRLDFFTEGDYSGWSIIDKLFPNQKSEFAIIEKPLQTGSMHIIFSKKLENVDEIKQKFSQGLKEIIDNGTYKRIFNNHGFE